MRHLDENDFILTSCPRADVRKHISLCNVSIFFIIPTYSKKASSATKMGEIMAMGKPVITNTGWGDVEALIDRKCGILVDELSQQGYLKSIDGLQGIKFDPVAIRYKAEQYFSLDKGIETYHSIYQQLAENWQE